MPRATLDRLPKLLLAAVLLVCSLLVIARDAAAAEKRHGVQTAQMDTTGAPCADFYRFANGTWLSSFKLPSSYSSYGSFEELFDHNQELVRALLDREAAGVKTAKPGSDEWKIGTFYSSCMDSARANATGSKPLAPLLAEIAAVRSPEQLAVTVAHLQQDGGTAMFRLTARQDFKNSARVIAFLGQGGLGLPDRDYYTREDSTSRALRDAYRAHVARTLQLTGMAPTDAASEATHIVELEHALAVVSMTRVQQRDPHATYHPMSGAELARIAPHFAWNAYFAALASPPTDTLNVAQPEFVHGLDSLLTAAPLADWTTYLRWQAASHAARWLDSSFVDEDFAFRSRLSGEKEIQPRWKRCMEETDGAIGEALGREYVKAHFTPETKQHALEMVHNLETALHDRLGGLDWMNDTTRVQAAAKLAAFGLKIGYPDRWRDYTSLRVEAGPFLPNAMAADEFEFRRVLAKIARPVDRGEWTMTPPTVNAYYNSSLNEIVFPAGILQPPFYDPQADDASNYGAMGAVIGHEMTHGFDDRGRQFDAQGNLRDWWTPGDAERFKSRAARVIDQFSGYVAVDTMHLNGRLTTGENIADLGGLAVAYQAFEHSLAGKPRPPSIDGYTPEQRFFLAYAQVWREIVRPEMARVYATTDPHSPGRWRTIGPLSNLPEFAQAFGCKSGDAMVRPDSVRVRIW
ncbi:MAG: M13 family metallopeptidase [Candidatus Eiseniibacteriota bacterium]